MSPLAAGSTPNAAADLRAARAHCERAVLRMAACRGNPGAHVERALFLAPDFVLAHCLRASLAVVAGDDAPAGDLALGVAAAERLAQQASPRERTYIEAARAWLAHDHEGALDRYMALCAQEPHDLLALVLAHATSLALGHAAPLRDLPRRALACWHPDEPGYADVLGLFAFGLEENGELHAAARMARRALAFDAGNARAIHAMAHVLETQGRHAEGLAWLARHPLAPDTTHGYRAHLEWHRALFELGCGNADAALRAFDRQVAGGEPRVSALADASNLLWRLRLAGIHAGSRWRTLARGWQRVAPRARRPFNVLHSVAAFVGSAQSGALRRVLGALRDHARRRPQDAATRVALAAGRALAAFARGDYRGAATTLLRLPQDGDPLGGSRVQRGLLRMTLRAAIRRLKAPAVAPTP